MNYLQTLFALLLFTVIAGHVTAKNRNHKVQKHGKQGRRFLQQLESEWSSKTGIYPSVLNAALSAKAEASATCGENGPEEYCRDMLPKSRWEGGVCGICEGPSGSPSRRHQPKDALDTDPYSWWQSPNLQEDPENEHIDFMVTLQDEMEVVYVILKAGPSPRPAAFSLEVSKKNNDTWTVIKSFARDASECERLWGVTSSLTEKTKMEKSHDELECSTKFSKMKPVENGEVYIAVGDNGIGVDAQRVRLKLRGLHEASAPDRRFYTIKSLTIAARCQCHGHADTCTILDGKTLCVCQHGTCGDQCEICCNPTSEWAHGVECKGSQMNVCPICENRALSCYPSDNGYECLNCTDNRSGPLCDDCLPGNYARISGESCSPCQCESIGSTGECALTPEYEFPVCECREGYQGVDCEVCADGFTGYPNCTNCRCDLRGVIEPDDSCQNTAACVCKQQVTGASCNICSDGYFGLNELLLEGCRECFCSGVSRQCSSSSEMPSQVSFQNGWVVTDLSGEYVVTPFLNEGHYYALNTGDFYEIDSYYWSSIQDFLGDRSEYYGTNIVFQSLYRISRGDTSGKPTVLPDVILINSKNTRIAYGERQYPNQMENIEITVPLTEDLWYEISDNGVNKFINSKVSRRKFMEILTDVRGVLLRAKFHQDQIEVRLLGVEIRGGDPIDIEHCACPIGYDGKSCQRCAPGYKKIELTSSESDLEFECLLCDCNGHTSSCTNDGQCGSCEHNTTGIKCERCLPGFYGNPLAGTPDDCKACACPLLIQSNNFSPNCALAELDGDEYVCTQCPDGYAGDHCETCDFGFWGNPITPGGACLPCNCDGSPCDSQTGECLTCPLHTTGFRCSACEEGFWRMSSEDQEKCVPCNCGTGSLAAPCDTYTGQCVCAPKYAGRACDRCESGHGGIYSDCPKCECSTIGAVNNECDAISGDCQCKSGVAEPKCLECVEGFFELDRDGCKSCNCSRIGAKGSSCDIVSGQCFCKPNVAGLKCDQCKEGFWNFSDEGCEACRCEAADSCNPITGECLCKPGVTGNLCDVCLPGYYGLTPSGCLSCPRCGGEYVCDQRTGRCQCPPMTMGADCRTCRPGSWGFVPGDGCKHCNCSSNGSHSRSCDLNGQCECKPGWTGRQCDMCSSGHFGPKCRPCSCNKDGTLPNRCIEGVCQCDRHGQCPCKESVVGLKCDTCRNGTFGLSAWKEGGCTQCYCFGRTSHCTQAGLTKATITHLTPHVLHIINETDSNQVKKVTSETLKSSFDVIPIPGSKIETYLSYSSLKNLPSAPLYWSLGKKFRGDHVTSYGGEIRFSTNDTGKDEFPAHDLQRFPLVQIKAHDDLVLDYFKADESQNGTHVVQLEESLWKLRHPSRKPRPNDSSAISRSALMFALQNVKSILIRATTHAIPYEAVLFNVSMDTALEIRGRPPPLADGVELCSCPDGYGATSCQEASSGFFIPKTNYSIDFDTGHVDVKSQALKCQCNGRSNVCDKTTGDCLNCTQNSGGPKCEVCAEGYYGSPNERDGCQLCQCPTANKNRALNCIRMPSDGRFICECRTGYTGDDCSQCLPGWRKLNGDCVECGCSSGALNPICDENGQCTCRDGVYGPNCNRCRAPMHALDGTECRECDNCTKSLFEVVHETSQYFKSSMQKIDLNLIPPPHMYLETIVDKMRSVQNIIWGIRNTEQYLKQYSDKELNQLKETVRYLGSQSKMFPLKVSEITKRVSLMLEDIGITSKTIQNLREKFNDIMKKLNDLLKSEHQINLRRAVKEAQKNLQIIKEINLSDFKSNAVTIFDQVQNQYIQVQDLENKAEKSNNELNQFKENLDEWNKKLDDFKRFNDEVWDSVDALQTKEENIISRKELLKSKFEEITEFQQQSYQLLKSEKNNEIELVVRSLKDILNAQSKNKQKLQDLIDETEKREGILNELNPKYSERFLIPAETHAENLTTLSLAYQSLFAETLNKVKTVLNVSTTYQKIRDDIELAKSLLLSSVEQTSKIKDIATAFLHRAVANRDTYFALNQKTEEYRMKAQVIDSNIEKLAQEVERISIEIRGIGWKDRDLSSTCAALSTFNLNETLSIANEKSGRVYENMRALYEESDAIAQSVKYQLNPRLQELRRQGDDLIGGAEENVSQVKSNIVKGDVLVSSLLEAAKERIKETRLANRTLSMTLKKLKQQIAKAKHTANLIRISIKSPPNGKCIRGYEIPNAVPSTTNRITVDLLFTKDNIEDCTLIFIPSTTGNNYLKLDIFNKKIRFSWKIGESISHVIHPEIMEAANGFNDIWYRIESERIWGTGKLTVRRKNMESVLVTNSTMMDKKNAYFGLNKESILWVGGNSLTEDKRLSACVQHISVDGSSIGLWNFKVQPQGSICSGCTERYEPASMSEEQNHYSFNGAGYVRLQRSYILPYNRRLFSVSFAFRSYDEDALLFFATDDATNRSASVTIRKCRIVFRVEYGPRWAMEIVSNGEHCDGKLHRVYASRTFRTSQLETGSLRIDGEETLGSPSPPVISLATLPALDKYYWLGGLGPMMDFENLPPPIKGCLGDVRVDHEGINPFSTIHHHGVEPSCGKNIITLSGFRSDGYIALQAIALGRLSHFGFIFRTQQRDAVLLLSIPEHSFGSSQSDSENEVVQDYDSSTQLDRNSETNNICYSVSLVKGEIIAIFNCGKGIVKMSSGLIRVNDGRYHNVHVSKSGKKVELLVDGISVSRAVLQGGGKGISPNGLMYLGGIENNLTQILDKSGCLATAKGLVGAMKDIVFDGRLISLDSMVKSSRALLGREGPQMDGLPHPTSDIDEPQAAAEDTRTCDKEPTYIVEAGTLRYGDTKESYTIMKLPSTSFWSDLSVALQIRTYYADGLIFFIPGHKSKQKHSLGVYLHNGRVTVSALRGRRRREVSVGGWKAGEWRRISLKISSSKITIVCGSRTASSRLPRHSLSLSDTMFFGGVPSSKRKHPSYPDWLWKSVGGMRGCIRKVNLNELGDEVLRNASHVNVGQCTPTVERGAHFPGDAYAIWSRSFSFIDKLEISVDMKTTQMNSTILVMADWSTATRAYFALEMVEGKLTMTLWREGMKLLSVATKLNASKCGLEDTWKTVKVVFKDLLLSMSIDDGQPIVERLTHSHYSNLNKVGHLYVGGLPDGPSINSQLSAKENYTGCLRKLTIDSVEKDWHEFDDIHNVIISSCPLK